MLGNWNWNNLKFYLSVIGFWFLHVRENPGLFKLIVIHKTAPV